MAGRTRDLERLLTFVDAVVAIAITLLVLPLADLAGQVRGGSAADLLREHSDDILGFLLSFAVIARLWLVQHVMVASLVRQSQAVIVLLLSWTFTIVFLPFPTVLVVSTSADPLAKVLYIGTMATSSALLTALAWVIRRERGLRDSDAAPEPLSAAVTTLMFLVALAVALAVPAVSYWALLLLLLTDPLVNVLRRALLRLGSP